MLDHCLESSDEVRDMFFCGYFCKIDVQWFIIWNGWFGARRLISISNAVESSYLFSMQPMMTLWCGNVFHVADALWVESTGHWWIPLRKGQWCSMKLWCLFVKNHDEWFGSRDGKTKSQLYAVLKQITWILKTSHFLQISFWPNLEKLFSYSFKMIFISITLNQN